MAGNARPASTWLYPFLFKPSKLSASSAHQIRLPRKAAFTSSSQPHRRPADTSTSNSSAGGQQRYGTANEPPPHFALPNKKSGQDVKTNERESKELKKDEKQLNSIQASSDSTNTDSPSSNTEASAVPAIGALYAAQQAKIAEQEKELSRKLQDASASQKLLENTGEKEEEDEEDSAPPPLSLSNSPSPLASNNSNSKNTALSTILRMEQPAVIASRNANDEQNNYFNPRHKPPHLQATQYVHHFDTYTLVRDLEAANYTESQAIILMKIVRLLLAENMELARQGLVSKGDAEMESYVFRAACSELRTEIRNARSTASTHARGERMQLQHEFDILSQRLSSETSSLKDELKGMFDDRKMAVRTERRDVENKLQELNYRITARLGSEMRQEVEGLRWVLVRRIAIAITCVAAMVLTGLRVSKYKESQNKNRRSNELTTTSPPPSSLVATHHPSATVAAAAIAGDGGEVRGGEIKGPESVELVPLG